MTEGRRIHIGPDPALAKALAGLSPDALAAQVRKRLGLELADAGMFTRYGIISVFLPEGDSMNRVDGLPGVDWVEDDGPMKAI